MSSTSEISIGTEPVAVYCASSMGNHKAYQLAAISVGHAIATARRRLVYGGGSKGIMGVVSGAALEKGGQVTGIVPHAMVAAGGEGSGDTKSLHVFLDEPGRESVESVSPIQNSSESEPEDSLYRAM
ncbi:hypothetical protein HGRIS_013599 [Hohenbuehelia grisea]|uniref:Uncharacterized protein n=1 Tax=Hohenbuehelia grisea TaxID=104357 RepID=A0ABR3IW25_9AGAR